MNVSDSDITLIESRLEEESIEIEEQLRDLDGIGESLAGVTLRLLSENSELSLLVQLVFDRQDEIPSDIRGEISHEIEVSNVFLGLDIVLSEFDLRLTDLKISISCHLLD